MRTPCGIVVPVGVGVVVVLVVVVVVGVVVDVVVVADVVVVVRVVVVAVAVVAAAFVAVVVVVAAARVVAAGGRYSPTLSRRTTHLLAPKTLPSQSSDKLAAAAAAPNRYLGLSVVNVAWLEESEVQQRRADEQRFAPMVQAVPAAADPRHVPYTHLTLPTTLRVLIPGCAGS